MSGATRSRLEMFRDEMVQRDRILAQLRDGPKRIAELAEVLGVPSHEIVCWVMAMRRYGQVEEQGKPDDEGYFRYAATATDPDPGTGKE